MSKDIYTISLLDLLPQSLKGDPDVEALAKALDPELQAVSAAIIECVLLPRVDELPEEVVDYLAWQLHVDFYDPNYSLAVKRTLVKQSIPRHRKKGTPAAVEELATTVFGSARVIGWYEYGGDPYRFRVITGNEQVVLGDRYAEFVNALESVKRKSAWLDDILFEGTFEFSSQLGVVETDANKGFADLEQTVGGTLSDIL
ncbi:phage tail protein I [Pelotomaculum propionicicum]|uniref:Phage tail protein I n=1 Tax=Pelotomaculum propionicicum TaxID=258475 RepID=A0A4Y7RWJ0_9FIRM|nr:phage tail protein I [Pelotomaculum propionicicum]TEB13354.1 hypothetical protein Pmgp_00248 [Pelotomaculum propionicicum]